MTRSEPVGTARASERAEVWPPRVSRLATHHGILLVDKPSGWTSHDVVARVRRLAGQRQAGHTGTLDPMAAGLLVVCLGAATRLVEYMVGHDKCYEGEITLGGATSTDDAEGEVIEERPVPPLTDSLLRDLELQFTGTLQQRPPAFSAVKVAGQRAYAVARKGGAPALHPRPVTVHEIALTSTSPRMVAIRVRCGPGTYVRSLARDIGEAMGSAAHLCALRRTSVGSFSVADAWSLDELATLAAAGRVDAALLPPDEGITGLDAAIVSPQSATLIGHGVPIAAVASRESGALRIYDSGGDFHGIGAVSADLTLRPVKVLTL